MSDEELKELCDRLIEEIARRLPSDQPSRILIGIESGFFQTFAESGKSLLEVLNEQ